MGLSPPPRGENLDYHVGPPPFSANHRTNTTTPTPTPTQSMTQPRQAPAASLVFNHLSLQNGSFTVRDDAEETAARNPGSEMPNNISNAALGGRVNLLKEPCQAAFEMNVNPCICCFCIFQLDIACWTRSHALRHEHVSLHASLRIMHCARQWLHKESVDEGAWNGSFKRLTRLPQAAFKRLTRLL
jgi:hypothetical protein